MTPQGIQANLSYAYLHAVAAQAGIACEATSWDVDQMGVDVRLTKDYSREAGARRWTQITLHVQIKATKQAPALREGHYSYYFEDIFNYRRLIQDTAWPCVILMVLFMPEDPDDWLSHHADGLTLRKCAYWTSLVGAPDTSNTKKTTVYLPEDQSVSPQELTKIFDFLSKMDRPTLQYQQKIPSVF